MKTLILSLALVLAFTTLAFAETGKDVAYTVNGEDYQGYFVSAERKGAPLVLLVHDWDGLNGYEIKRAHMLGRLGYDVFAADLFGAGVRPTEDKDKRQHTGELYKDREKMRALLFGALSEAEAQGADSGNAVVTGYCFGGAAVLEMARAGADLKGFATFHGGLSTPEGQDYSNTKGFVLVMHGTADSAISMDDFAELARQLESHQVPHEMITYGGAKHAFSVFDGDRYDAYADEKSWERFLAFLDERLDG
ncbi:MAG: dienelactone hydrolase family protein [Desulfovibrionales bacterium]